MRGLAAHTKLWAPRGLTTSILGTPVDDGPAPEPWPAGWRSGRSCADGDRVRYEIRGQTLYLEQGRRVVLAATDAESRLSHDYLAYSVGARWLLLQRGRFALHAAALVSPDGMAVALGGSSGVGKSTAAVELLTRGWRLAVDDSCQLRVNDAAATLQPFRRPVHLYAEHADRLGGPFDIGRPLPFTVKRAFDMDQDLTDRPLSLVVSLAPPGGDRVSVTRLSGTAAALELLTIATHGVGQLAMVEGLVRSQISSAAQLASLVPVFRISRPTDRPTADQIADVIEGLLSSTVAADR